MLNLLKKLGAESPRPPGYESPLKTPRHLVHSCWKLVNYQFTKAHTALSEIFIFTAYNCRQRRKEQI